ncbi:MULTISPECIES: hypothetical protein [unclassified Streptomyces]|uniref:hypothetical protein n=1 Tax=Streptomyces sp. NBRC 14336 TaxID=3030992 RepID=UPI002552D72C|nr:hypothetical protein [Streptomyces sp. NBRC 14336]WBO77581.1 hypothetical protein SBE_001110 [Streptomyces sp. SBE_14.2]
MKVTRPMLAAVAVLVLAGCGSGGGDDSADDVPKTASGSLEQLAAEVKCAPDIQIDADDIRQAICKGGGHKFILATFATDRGQREWINGAKDYGGHYLVGRKWVAVGDESSTLKSLREKLGGDLEEGTDHSAHEGGSGGGDDSGHDSGH